MSKLYKIKLKTISPVHIWGGRILNRNGDYIYSDNKVYYIDKGKLSKFFMSRSDYDSIMDDYIELVGLYAGIKIKVGTLKLFFDKYDLNYEDYSENIYEVSSEISEEINEFIKTSGRPYIPGTSLKGCIRTAILYDYVRDGNINKYIIDNNLKTFKESNIFGYSSDDVFKNLQVSDTSLFTKEDIDIGVGRVYNLKNNKGNIPIVLETLKKDVQCTSRIKLSEGEEKFEFLNLDIREGLFTYINRFSEKLIEKEIASFSRSKDGSFLNVLNFYYDLLDEVRQALYKKDRAILRIGRKKTFYNNGIGLALDKDQLKQLIRGNHKLDYDFFPKTRYVISRNNNSQVLGWVEMEVEE